LGKLRWIFNRVTLIFVYIEVLPKIWNKTPLNLYQLPNIESLATGRTIGNDLGVAR
jgi:hypothetical protein